MKYPEGTKVFFCPKCGVNSNLIEVSNAVVHTTIAGPYMTCISTAINFKELHSYTKDAQVELYTCEQCNHELSYNKVVENMVLPKYCAKCEAMLYTDEEGICTDCEGGIIDINGKVKKIPRP